MGAKRRERGMERLMDAVSFRVSPSQRAFLEKIAEDKNVGLCEAGRIIIDEAMARAGAEKCQ
jgi:hypothetical protein